jgi:NAD(P)-dependent dehydrogenase (short-subunit alcohol dehydrogenase family)
MATASRRAVVTGGGRGIGRAVAGALTRAGHDVTVLGRTATTLDEAVAAGDAAAAQALDVTDTEALSAYLSATAVDILVNNAGVADSAPFAKTDLAHFRRLMAVNFESVVAATHAVLPGMTDRGFGRVISVASVAGLKGYPYVSAYCASKHAVIGLTRALAMEMAQTGVTVNAVCPGYVDTDLVRDGAARVAARTGRAADEIVAQFARHNPQGRFVTAEEVAAAVVWLASAEAAAVTGQAIAIDGGETA